MRIFLLLNLFIFSCSNLTNSIVVKNTINRSDQKIDEKFFKDGLNVIQIFLNKTGRAHYSHYLKQININENNCREDEYACTFRGEHPYIIFINSNFFILNKPEQLSTLVHELHHLVKTIHQEYEIDGKLSECDNEGDKPYPFRIKIFKICL